MKQFCKLLLVSLLAGCASFPEADIAFMDRHINVGLPENEAIRKVGARGFTESAIRPRTRYEFNRESENFEPHAVTFEETVRFNLGFKGLTGEPRGNLRCFRRNKSGFLTQGERIMCWTADEGGIITWRQADYRGASL